MDRQADSLAGRGRLEHSVRSLTIKNSSDQFYPVTLFSDGGDYLIGCQRTFYADFFCRQIDTHAGCRILGLQRLSNSLDAVTAGHAFNIKHLHGTSPLMKPLDEGCAQSRACHHGKVKF